MAFDNTCMTIFSRFLFLLCLVMVFFDPTISLAQSESDDNAALNATVYAVCGREVVMIGESATHGDGHTESFKVALVEMTCPRKSLPVIAGVLS